MYADDTIVLAEDEKELQKALNAVKEYCTSWHLTVNTSKTKVVIFSGGKVRNRYNFTFGDVPVEVVDEYTYLGTTFNYNNRFNKSANNHINEARRSLFSLLNKSANLNLPLDIQLELYDQLVLPILLYGCEVWGLEDLKQLEAFHLKFCKNVLKLNRYTPYCAVYGELDRYKLNKTIDSRMINFWCRIINGGEYKLSSMVYKLLRALHEKYIYSSPWILKVKSVLDKTGMSYVWDIPTINDGQYPILNQLWLKREINRRLNDIYEQDWLTEVNNNSHCKNYRIFKQSLCFEKYLIILNQTDLINLCKFRCGNTHIASIHGRYQNIPFHDRICNICTDGKIGDEFHYIFECPAFTTERNTYLRHYFRTRPNTMKMALVMQSNSKQVLKNIS